MAEPAPPRRSRALRRLLIGVLVLVVLGVVGFAGAGWYYSGEIAAGALEVHPSPRAFEPDTVVERLEDGTAVLRRTDEASGDDPLRGGETYGLVWAGGAGVLSGPADVRDDGSVGRALEVVDGSPPAPGAAADLRGDVWTDPEAAYGTD